MIGLRDLALGAAVLFLVAGGGRGLVKRETGVTGPATVEAAPAAAAVSSSGAISLHADRRGHFTTSALVNGRVVSMMVDTGASLCAFSEEEAENLGIRVAPGDFRRSIMTANGAVRVASVRLRLVQIGPVAVRDVEAVVVPRGRLGTSLLGMSFLSRLRDFSVAGGRLTLRG